MACLNEWIASPQLSIFSNVAIAQDLTQALNEQKQLQHGQSVLTLDGYHVGQDWVIALMYDDESQSAQGMLSHRIRLDEIEQALEKQQPQLQALDEIVVQQKDELAQLQSGVQHKQQVVKQKQKTYNSLMCKLPSNKPQHKHFTAKQQLKDQLGQLDMQLEEDAMQKMILKLICMH